MLCENRDIGFRAIYPCSRCKKYQQGKLYRLSELIPSGHCFELLHSLLPYMVTFMHGGYFKWERSKNRVVVCCPSVERGICVELKRIQESDRRSFEYKILEVRGNCKFYHPSETFEIDNKNFSGLCWELFNIIFSYLKTEHNGAQISCGADEGESQFELFEVKNR